MPGDFTYWCSRGSAHRYATFASKGDVASGILLTTITMIVSVLVSTLTLGFLAGSVVVPMAALAMSK